MKECYTAIVLCKVEDTRIGSTSSKTFSSRMWREVEWCGHRHKRRIGADKCALYMKKHKEFVVIRDEHGELWSITTNQKLDAVKVESKEFPNINFYCLKENP